jgi:hypothetical protein
MELITQKGLVCGVAERWRQSYPANHGYGPDKDRIWHALKALDKNKATPADVEQIIGNDSWTSLKCDECGNESEIVVRVGEEPDYESATASLCPACINKAASIIAAEHPTRDRGVKDASSGE